MTGKENQLKKENQQLRRFLQLLDEKFMKMPRHGSLLEKLKFFAKSMVSRAFSRNEALLATFSRKVDRNAKTLYFVRKSCIVLAKSMISRAFPRNEGHFATS